MTGGAGLDAAPALAQVRAYWEALRGGRLLPDRAEVSPRGIEQALPGTFMLERIAPGQARFRLAGMHLADLMGMDVRGMPLSALIVPAGRAAVADKLAALFDMPARLELWLGAPRALGRPPLDARMTLLPLRGNDGAVNRVLGCLVSEGAVGRPPRRMAVTRARLFPLADAAATRPETVADGLAEAAAPFEGAPRRPRLRLIPGGAKD